MQKPLGWVATMVLGLILGTPSATAQTENTVSGKIVELKVPAPSLKGNLLGTHSIQNASVYLPAGYDQQSDRRFPVVYLLHGIFDDNAVWTENYGVAALLDRRISHNSAHAVIAVMPDGGNLYGGGYYRNSTTSGNWADYITEDLIGFVDANFRTLPSQEHRAVIGHSMGGYGALHIAIEHPGAFSVVWAMSPCCLAPLKDLSFGNDAWRRAQSVDDPSDIQTLINNQDFYPIALLGLVTAFNPDPSNEPVFGQFPFDVVRGEIVLREQSFDAYADLFPVRQVRAARAHLRQLRGLGLGVGLSDQFLHIPAGTPALSQKLGEERVPHRLDVYSGDHRQRISDRLEDIVLPWVFERLDTQD